MYKRIILLLLALSTSSILWAQHTVSGTVIDKTTGETLIGATVLDKLSGKGTVTNSYGFFTLTLKSDSANIRISYIGYQTQHHALKLGQSQKLNVALEASTELQEVVITAERPTDYKASQMSAIEVPVEQLQAVPVLFGESDILKALQLLPGVQSGSEGQSGMYVRGGGPDENLFLIDGVPVYNVNHAGGFFSAFNSDAVKNVTLYKGSFPAHFGGRLSSVMDLTTNNGNDKEYHGGISIGLISAKLNVEGPIIKERTTFSFSARRTYGDVLLQPILRMVAAMEYDNDTKINAGYYFYDLNAKVTHKFNDRSRLYASYYMGDDGIYARTRYRYYDGESEYMNLGYSWGNIVGSLRWNYELTPKLFMNVTGAYTRYRNLMEIGTEAVSPTYHETISMSYNSGINDFTARADFDYAPNPDHAVKFGLQALHHTFTPEVSSVSLSEQSINMNFDTILGQSLIHANEYTLYAEDDWNINDKFKVNAGLNFTSFAVEGKIYPSLQPRVSGRMLITDDLSFKAGYAYMTQYMHLLCNSSISLPTDLWVPVTSRILPMTSRQVAAGLFYNFIGMADFSVEGYYKHMTNLLEYKDGASFLGNSVGWEDKVCMGDGWSYGIEFLAQKTIGQLTGWIGYTWSHANRQFEQINDGEVFPAKYDRRHDISIVATWKPSKTFDASLSWVFSTGDAATLAMQEFSALSPDQVLSGDYYEGYGDYVGYVSHRNNYRRPNYHRMDVSFNFHKKLKHGSRTINLSVYNAYNHQNPYLIYEREDYDYASRRYVNNLVQLSIFTILPSISYTWKF